MVFSIPSVGGSQSISTGSSSKHDEQDDMIKNQLQSIVKKATELLSNIDTQNIEPWVVSKIPLADDYIDSVYDRLRYDTHDDSSSDIYTTSGYEDTASCGCDSSPCDCNS
jgi:hypothetical protein